MTVVVTLLAIVVALLAVMVVGLLRTNADVLRALEQLGAGLEDGGPGARHRTDDQPGPNAKTGRPAIDITGGTLSGGTQGIRVTNADHDTLLLFLSSGCLTCRSFWDQMREAGGLGLPRADPDRRRHQGPGPGEPLGTGRTGAHPRGAARHELAGLGRLRGARVAVRRPGGWQRGAESSGKGPGRRGNRSAICCPRQPATWPTWARTPRGRSRRIATWSSRARHRRRTPRRGHPSRRPQPLYPGGDTKTSGGTEPDRV